MSLDATITQCNELKKKLQTGDLEGCKPLLSKLKVSACPLLNPQPVGVQPPPSALAVQRLLCLRHRARVC